MVSRVPFSGGRVRPVKAWTMEARRDPRENGPRRSAAAHGAEPASRGGGRARDGARMPPREQIRRLRREVLLEADERRVLSLKASNITDARKNHSPFLHSGRV